jgi:hypothetical protein
MQQLWVLGVVGTSKSNRMASVSILKAMMESEDPVLRYLANGGSWGDAALLEEELEAERKAKAEAERLALAVGSIPKWEAQLESVLRKGSTTPSALKHKGRLVESLREAYKHAGRDPRDADAFAAGVEAKVRAELEAKAVAAAKVAAKPKGAFGALADSDEE